MEAPGWLAEVLPNVHTAYLFVRWPAPPEGGHASAEAGGGGSGSGGAGEVAVSVSLGDAGAGGGGGGSVVEFVPRGEPPLRLALPFAVHPEEWSRTARADHLELKMRLAGGELVVPASEGGGGEEGGAGRLHSHLAGGGALHCRGCGGTLAAALRSAVELPSPHWQEMAEAWFCSCCGGEDRGLAMLETLEERLMVREGRCQVSTSVCVVTRESVGGAEEVPVGVGGGEGAAWGWGRAGAGVEPESGADAEDWQGLQCKACGSFVGLVGTPIPGAGLARAATLFKHRLATSAAPGGEGDLFHGFSLENAVAADLRAPGTALLYLPPRPSPPAPAPSAPRVGHACYRFVVRPLGAGMGVGAREHFSLLQLVVLSWDTLVVRQEKAEGGGTAAPVLQPVLKLLYRVCTASGARGEGVGAGAEVDGPVEVAAEPAAEWVARHRPEEILMAPSEAAALARLLWHRTREYPPSARGFMGFSVGYLLSQTE